MCGVQDLAVGGCAQKLPQTGRLRAGRTQSVLHLTGVEPQQMPHSSSSGQRAGRAGGVKHTVVRSPQKFAHTDTHFVTHHRSGQQLLAAGTQGLRHRHRRRKHHRGRMEHRAVVHIVLLGYMRSRGVDHGGQVRRVAGAVYDHLGRTLSRSLGRSHRSRKTVDVLHRARTMSAHRGAKPVDQQVFGLADHGLGNVFESQLRCKGGELGRVRSHAFSWRWGGQMDWAWRRACTAASSRPSSRRIASVCSPTAGTGSMR